MCNYSIIEINIHLGDVFQIELLKTARRSQPYNNHHITNHQVPDTFHANSEIHKNIYISNLVVQ